MFVCHLPCFTQTKTNPIQVSYVYVCIKVCICTYTMLASGYNVTVLSLSRPIARPPTASRSTDRPTPEIAIFQSTYCWISTPALHQTLKIGQTQTIPFT